MRAIVVKEEGEIEDGDRILFPRLLKLVLDSLPKLLSFSSKGCLSITEAEGIILEENNEFYTPILDEQVLFPELRVLELSSIHLEEMARFSGRLTNIQPITSRFQNLSSLIVKGCSNMSSSTTARKEVMTADEKPHNVMQPLFNEEVAMPKLELLKISHIDGVESMWHNRFTANSCCKLRQVNVQECANLKSFFPPTMMKVLRCLELLIIENCGSLTKVFDIEVPSFQEMGAMTATQFKTLRLTGLPKLMHIWEKDPKGTFNFQNLQIVTLTGCESLQSVFPASVSGKLKQLEFLVLDSCGVEVVIEKKGAQVAETLQFPKLTALVLASLPKLKCFSRGMHPSKWPSLKILKVYGCGQIEKFALFQERQVDASIPLFVVDEGAFPELEDLTLELNRAVWPGQFLEELLCKLKVLWVGCNYDGGDFSPSTFIGRLHNLETLRVCSNKWKEIFPYEVLFGQENHARSLTNLREVEFFENPMLTHLWKEDMQPCPIFENLKILKVSECHKLSNLVPSTVSFQNLTNLEIFKCGGLIHLFTSSTARSLVQLQKLSVSECTSIMEIVGSEGGEANEVITFSNLAYLKLDCLAHLTQFCSISYSFDFPALAKVTMRQCPEMKIFCPGVLSTPKLKKVQATEEGQEWHWIKDDLNATIDWLWEHKL
ncbi:hypothetical protein CJ030_MR8G007353 [Morella rubra]|uniref:Disease resistance protein At4g27190-like leucine-rich repeats domain-containing protein n=1 Tax=Morella rubra TaxID=262757 RepID=A0A6A1UPW7_9ROSI|nr:hypothetical protein CJ030_MR8G007353 [Morella rubra]